MPEDWAAFIAADDARLRQEFFRERSTMRPLEAVKRRTGASDPGESSYSNRDLAPCAPAPLIAGLNRERMAALMGQLAADFDAETWGLLSEATLTGSTIAAAASVLGWGNARLARVKRRLYHHIKKCESYRQDFDDLILARRGERDQVLVNNCDSRRLSRKDGQTWRLRKVDDLVGVCLTLTVRKR